MRKQKQLLLTNIGLNKLKMTKKTLLMLLALVLSSCASHSMYKEAKGSGYGYTEEKLNQTHYLVQYKTAETDQQRAKDFALLRAAELTSEQGYDWFIVTQRETNQDNNLGIRVIIEINFGKGVRPTKINTTTGDTTSYEAQETINSLRLKLKL
jgi:hypothetical protein